MELKKYILADKYRYIGESGGVLKAYRLYDGFRFSFWMRICHKLRERTITKYTLFPLCRVMYKHYKYKYGYDIPYTVDIGPGLLIYHFGGIVLSARKCGKNLTISQNVTVGMTIHDDKKYFPVIGDNVYLAPGCAVIGNVVIGEDVAVGTNAVVTKSVEDHAILVGIPAKVISHNGAARYVNNPITE